MSEFLRIFAPVAVALFLQSVYLAYRFGRLEQTQKDHGQRIVRLESASDAITHGRR